MGLVVYSALNLLRLAHDTAITASDGGGAAVRGEGGVSRGAWNAYLLFLRRRSPLARRLLTFLNVAWTLQVPAEMLVQRIWGLTAKLRYLVILEISKAAARLLIFVSGGLRPILRNYLPDLGVEASRPRTDPTEELLSEIKLAGGKETEGVQRFLRKHRTDSQILVPELSMTPRRGRREILREISHIIRPALYATAMALSLTRAGSRHAGRLRWVAWSLSLGLDLFCEWPQLHVLLATGEGKQSHPATSEAAVPLIEREERQMRLIRLLLYLLREPLYSSLSKPYLDSVYETLSKWRILRPLVGKFPSFWPRRADPHGMMLPTVETGRSYQKLCERVFLYTLGS